MNILQALPTVISHPVSRTILKTRKASPTILFVGGVVGVVATAVAASRATMKLDEIVGDAKENIDKANMLVETLPEKYTPEDRQKDLVIIYTKATIATLKIYTPAILLGAASIAALTGSHVILTRRNAALTAAYAALDQAFKEYRGKVVQDRGLEADREIVQQVITKSEIPTIPGVPQQYSMYARFFDNTCRNWSPEPSYNFAFLRGQQNYANDLLLSRGHVFLNDIYDMLGMARSREGSVVGWVVPGGGDNYIDFGIFDGRRPAVRDFVNRYEQSIMLDFNVDGVIYDKI